MNPSPQELRSALEELADALQGAIGLSAQLRDNARPSSQVANELEEAIGRAAGVLKRLQPPSLPRSGR